MSDQPYPFRYVIQQSVGRHTGTCAVCGDAVTLDQFVYTNPELPEPRPLVHADCLTWDDEPEPDSFVVTGEGTYLNLLAIPAGDIRPGDRILIPNPAIDWLSDGADDPEPMHLRLPPVGCVWSEYGTDERQVGVTVGWDSEHTETRWFMPWEPVTVERGRP